MIIRPYGGAAAHSQQTSHVLWKKKLSISGMPSAGFPAIAGHDSVCPTAKNYFSL
jgi:hypothetical protein